MSVLSSHITLIGGTIKVDVPLPETLWSDCVGESLNAQIDFFRAGIERNESVIGTGVTVSRGAASVSVSIALPDGAPAGLYFLADIRLIAESGEHVASLCLSEQDRFFCVLAADDSMPANETEHVRSMIQRRTEQRNLFLNTPIYANEEKVGERHRVAILINGCMVHGQQNLPGIQIIPLGIGLGYGEQFGAANHYLLNRLNRQIDYEKNRDQQARSQNPVIAIEFSNILAKGLDEAVNHAYQTTEFLLTVLAVDRGQKGSAFFWCAQKHGEDNWHVDFLLPVYRGNLISHFDVGHTGRFAENVLKKSARSNWIRLVCESYALAVNEQDYGSKFLRHWTVLEMIAKSYVPKSNTILVDPAGQEIIKNGLGHKARANNALGQVYKYLYDDGLIAMNSNYDIQIPSDPADYGNPNSEGAKRILSLTQYQLLSGAYEIRNHIGHKGRYDPTQPDDPEKAEYAEAVYFADHGIGLFHLKSYSQLAVLRELAKPPE